MPASKKNTAATRVATPRTKKNRSYVSQSRAAKRTYKRLGNVRDRINQCIERESQQPQLPLTDEPWLSIREIAERLGMTAAGVRRWMYSGKLRYRRFGREVRIPLSELERFSGGYSAASLKAIRAATKKNRAA